MWHIIVSTPALGAVVYHSVLDLRGVAPCSHGCFVWFLFIFDGFLLCLVCFVQFNISYPSNGAQKVIEIEDERKL